MLDQSPRASRTEERVCTLRDESTFVAGRGGGHILYTIPSRRVGGAGDQMLMDISNAPPKVTAPWRPGYHLQPPVFAADRHGEAEKQKSYRRWSVISWNRYHPADISWDG